MSRALVLRDDHVEAELRRLSRRGRHADQSPCLMALASIYDGTWCAEGALLAGLTVRVSVTGRYVPMKMLMVS